MAGVDVIVIIAITLCWYIYIGLLLISAGSIFRIGVCRNWKYEFKMNNLTRNENTRKISQIDNDNISNSNKSVPFR